MNDSTLPLKQEIIDARSIEITREVSALLTRKMDEHYEGLSALGHYVAMRDAIVRTAACFILDAARGSGRDPLDGVRNFTHLLCALIDVEVASGAWGDLPRNTKPRNGFLAWLPR